MIIDHKDVIAIAIDLLSDCCMNEAPNERGKGNDKGNRVRSAIDGDIAAYHLLYLYNVTYANVDRIVRT
jgi:hypothetical protein